MSDTTPNLDLPYILPGQAQKHVTHNEALQILDACVQLCLEAVGVNFPPASPANGQVWAIGDMPTGAWFANAGHLAVYAGNGWLFVQPEAGWIAWDRASGSVRVWRNDMWDAVPLANLEGLGIGTTYDAANRLSVVSPATLLSHDGAGHQLKINKAATSDTASLLFQTGWSGRAEMGLCGSDAFAIKSSANGTAWAEALVVTPATGRVLLPAGVSLSTGSAAAPALSFAADTDTGLTRPASDQIGVCTGGVQRAAFSNAGMALSGLLTGTAVTQDATDLTTGRLVKVNDFGLGTAITLTASDNLNDLTASGSYYNPTGGNAAGNNYPITSAGSLDVVRRSATQSTQTFISFASPAAASGVRMFVRSIGVGSVWSPWVEVYHQGTIVGSVSQASGVPTGRVMERGSNANGEFIRLADGTQFCWRLGPPISCQTAQGAMFMNMTLQTWTFPAAFAAAASISMGGSGGSTARFLANGPPSALTVNYRVLSAFSDASEVAPNLFAIGRWF